jgi:hypothetical protein
MEHHGRTGIVSVSVTGTIQKKSSRLHWFVGRARGAGACKRFWWGWVVVSVMLNVCAHTGSGYVRDC